MEIIIIKSFGWLIPSSPINIAYVLRKALSSKVKILFHSKSAKTFHAESKLNFIQFFEGGWFLLRLYIGFSF